MADPLGPLSPVVRRSDHGDAVDGADVRPGVAVRAWLLLVAVVLARSYRAFLLTLVGAAIIPSIWGWSSYVVRSGSMEPTLAVGDVVVGLPFSSATAAVPVGRVMVFTRPQSSNPDEIFLHRVVKLLDDGTYATAGDANSTRDADPVAATDFTARAGICVPWVGIPLTWWADRDLGPLLTWLLLTVLAFALSSWPRRSRRDRGAHTAASASGRSPATAPAPEHRPTRRGAGAGAGAGAVAAVAALCLTGFVAEPVGAAPTPFSAGTTNPRSTWRVAVTPSKAASLLVVYDTAGSSGWYQRGQVSVHVSATADAGATVRSITYGVNGGAAVTVAGSSLGFTLSRQGDNTITYFATDGRGAAERVHTTHLRLDNAIPTLAISSRTGDLTHAEWRAACGASGGVCGSSADGVGSGVATVTYVVFRSSDQRCFNGTTWTTATCSVRTPVPVTAGGAWVVPVPDARLPVARTWYTVTMYVTDVAGNGTNTSKNFSVG